MPYKFDTDKKKVGRKNDKRIKLSLQDRKEIKDLYGKISQRKLAKAYGVSRRLIIFIGCPEKYIQNLKDRADRGGSKFYYHPDTQKEYMKKHRHYKKSLNEDEKLEQGGKEMEVKQRCRICKEWFINHNANRVYCYECSPKTSVNRWGKNGKKNNYIET